MYVHGVHTWVWPQYLQSCLEVLHAGQHSILVLLLGVRVPRVNPADQISYIPIHGLL